MKTITKILGQSAKLRNKAGVLRANGKIEWASDFRENLILDTGLDMAGSYLWSQCFSQCLFGDQVAPEEVRRDSALITFTTAGTACTASGNFFVLADVGRLMKFNDVDGQERYISAFIDAQHVTLSVAPTTPIAGDSCTIWYVNQTALQSLNQATSTYRTGGGACGTSTVANVRTMKRTYTGDAAIAPVTLTEIGFSNGGGNANIFDRDLIPGGIALGIGDIPLAVCELIVTYGPTTPVSVANFATGCDMAGDYVLGLMDNFGSVNSFGNPDFSGSLDFVTNGAMAFQIATATFTLPTFGTPQGPAAQVGFSGGAGLLAYTGGTRHRDWTGQADIATANGNIFGFFNWTAGGASVAWAHLFTASFAKLNTQTLTFTIRRTWDRDLTN